MKALFSVDNLYDQPANNLIILWKDKPTLEELGIAIGYPFPCSSDENTLNIVNLWSGKEVRLNDIDYRLEDIRFGEKI